MLYEISFSIIIPHKNIPELLQRCLNSIPYREDLQVIVVDDNSDSNKVDFNNFPKWQSPNYKVIFTKEGKGAGYARNIGMRQATGKWILFVDADDLVLPSINTIFNEYILSDADIIYFNPISVLSDDLQHTSERASFYNSLIDKYFETKGDTSHFIRWFSPWSKIINRKIIEGVLFDEIKYGNDCVFSVTTFCNAQKISVSRSTFYAITQRHNSLTSNFMNKPEEEECRVSAFFRSFIVAKNENKQISLFIDDLKLLTKKMYCKNWALFAQGCHLLNTIGFSTISVIKDNVKEPSKFNRWLQYIRTYCHIILKR